MVSFVRRATDALLVERHGRRVLFDGGDLDVAVPLQVLQQRLGEMVRVLALALGPEQPIGPLDPAMLLVLLQRVARVRIWIEHLGQQRCEVSHVRGTSDAHS